MKTHTLQTSFISGAIDEIALGRAETSLYRNGAKAIVNGLLLSTGGVLSRWGTAHCATLPGVPRMVEFTFSQDQAYIAVFLAGRVNFYFAEDGAAAGTLTVCPWTEAMVDDLRFAQGGDVMWIVHPDMQPQLIRRVGATSWTRTPWTPDDNLSRPFYRYAPARVSCVWDLATTTLTMSEAVFDAGHNGRGIRVYDTADSIYRIGTLTILDSVTALVTWDTDAPADTNDTTLWEEEAFSVARGWPRSVCLYQQRLVFGGARDAGDAIWASQTARYGNFDVGTAQDGEALAFSLGISKVRAIRHVIAGQQIVFLTDSSAFWLPEADDRPLTPAGLLRVRNIAEYGVGSVRPGAFDGGILMVQTTGRAVRDLVYSNERENLIADPVSLAATGILGNVVDAAYLSGAQDRPEQYAFFVNADGKIAVFHSIREQKIGAWAEWTTDGEFVAVGTAAGSVFAAVRRAGTVRLERFDPDRAFDASSFSYQPFNGLTHLAGQVVHGRVGDDYLGVATVTGGGLAVTQRESLQGVEVVPGLAEIGLGFDWWIDPLPPALELPDGSIVGRVQRVLRTGVRLYRARAARIGGSELTLLADGFAIGVAPPLRDGWWHAGHLGWARRGSDAQIIRRIDRDIPMPVGVLAMRREVIV